MARSTDHHHRAVHRTWGAWGTAVRTLTPGSASGSFADVGYLIGHLPLPLVDDFLAEMRAAETLPLRPEDWSPGYRRSEKAHKIEKRLNAGHRYRVLTPGLARVLAEIGHELEAPVRRAIGARWRVVNTRVLETLPTAEEMGPNAWHGDGFPVDILKVMIYFTEAGEATGTTELRLEDGSEVRVEGPPGTWLLFRNSEIVHRGLPPRTEPRIAVEITLIPALRQATAPVFAGLNSTYPEHPGWRVPPLRWAWSALVARPLRALDDRNAPKRKVKKRPPSPVARARARVTRRLAGHGRSR